MLGIKTTRRFLAHPFSKKARKKAKVKRQLRKAAKAERRNAADLASAAHEAEIQVAYWATLATGVAGVVDMVLGDDE